MAKKPQFWGGKRSGMNYYANILSMHEMLRQIQIHALNWFWRLMASLTGRKFENQQFHLFFLGGGKV